MLECGHIIFHYYSLHISFGRLDVYVGIPQQKLMVPTPAQEGAVCHPSRYIKVAHGRGIAAEECLEGGVHLVTTQRPITRKASVTMADGAQLMRLAVEVGLLKILVSAWQRIPS